MSTGTPPRPEGRSDLPPTPQGIGAEYLPGLLDCMHCGLCLETCATYRLSAEEAQSPRGRLFLMRAVEEGRLPASAATPALSSCLQCRACESVCPSKVDYHGVLDRYLARAPASARPRPSRLIPLLRQRWTWRAFTLMLALMRRSGLAYLLRQLPWPRLQLALAAIPPQPRPWRAKAGTLFPAQAPTRARILLMRGCVENAWQATLLEQAVALFQQQGVEVLLPAQPNCCGAFAGHAGDADGGRTQARAMLAALRKADAESPIVVLAAGCHAWLQEIDPQAKLVEACEFLQGLGLRGSPHPISQRVALQQACHQQHVGPGFEATRALLAALPQLELVEDPEAMLCCGAGGGTFLREPEQAQRLGKRKLAALLAEQPQILLSANPGCRQQLHAAQGKVQEQVAILHPIELLARAYLGAED